MTIKECTREEYLVVIHKLTVGTLNGTLGQRETNSNNLLIQISR
jgi:hypothetical protein